MTLALQRRTRFTTGSPDQPAEDLGVNEPSEEGYLVVVTSGNRAWALRTLFSTPDAAELVAAALSTELPEVGLRLVLDRHAHQRMSRRARARLGL